MRDITLTEVFQRLAEHFGPMHWWPGETPLEIIVGAVLTQNTAWKNVEKAIANLRENDALDIDAIHRMPIDELAELIRPAGYYRLKAKRLKNLLTWIHDRFGGDLDAMFSTRLATLREELLQVNGIGPETADSILLYAGNLPTFVVDAYTARVLKRHGWIEPEADYYAIKEFFESSLESDPMLFNEYHALLVNLGKDYCRKRPRCEGCPLQAYLPEGFDPAGEF